MTKQELLDKLRELQKSGDPENAHIQADGLLLQFINDEDIKEAFDGIEMWYS